MTGARCPFAQWRGPVPNMTPGGMVQPIVGVVFHIMGASMAAADDWFHNPSAQASAHFGIAQSGELVQWVDVGDRAWHAAAANRHWIGVETEGSGGPLSDAGVITFGRLYRWLADLYHLPFVQTDDPVNGAGLGWHGMGGAAWGGHDYCPGEPRKIQRQHILDLAHGQPTPPEVDDDMAYIIGADNRPGNFLLSGSLVTGLADGQSAQAFLDAGAKAVKVSPAEFDHLASLAR